jgi:hypothetical protein
LIDGAGTTGTMGLAGAPRIALPPSGAGIPGATGAGIPGAAGAGGIGDGGGTPGGAGDGGGTPAGDGDGGAVAAADGAGAAGAAAASCSFAGAGRGEAAKGGAAVGAPAMSLLCFSGPRPCASSSLRPLRAACPGALCGPCAPAAATLSGCCARSGDAAFGESCGALWRATLSVSMSSGCSVVPVHIRDATAPAAMPPTITSA